ncbi:protein phosphatase [Scenedesmus sp. PABB004]|nr:protein phosphatase [Scenedesmus sp. PABB004]
MDDLRDLPDRGCFSVVEGVRTQPGPVYLRCHDPQLAGRRSSDQDQGVRVLNAPPQLLQLYRSAHRRSAAVAAKRHARAPPDDRGAKRVAAAPAAAAGDAELTSAHRSLAAKAAPASGGEAGGIAAGRTGYASQLPEAVSVMSCGGELDASRATTVGTHRATYGAHTQAGADPGGNTKDNQDAWCVQERLAGHELALFGVFDGHGQEGKAVSHTVCEQLPRIMARLLAGKAAPAAGGIEAALTAAFPEANACVRHRAGLDADLSGSTGIVAVLAPHRLVAANLGDSRCVLGKVDARGAVTAVALSADHTPMDDKEAQRVVAAGGRIASFMCGDEPLGPPRVWLRDVNVPGLCMTRSFGDYVAATVGVIDTPALLAAPLTPADKYVVLMSDGIFEFIDSQAVMEEVHAAARAGLGPNDAARRLVRLARKSWQEQEDDIIDDCTAVVIYLTPAAPGSGGNGASGGGGASGVVAGLAARLEAGLRLGHGAAGGQKRG